VAVSFQTGDKTKLTDYPEIDDVGYMLDTLPPGAIPKNTSIKFSPRSYEQQWGRRGVKRIAKSSTYASAIQEMDENDNKTNVIRVYPLYPVDKIAGFPKFREAFIHELGHVQDNEYNIDSDFRNTGLYPDTAITDYGQKNRNEDVAESFVHYNKVGGHFNRTYRNIGESAANRLHILEQKVPHTQLQSNPNVREAVESSLQLQTTKSHPSLERTYEELESDAREKQHTYSPEELPFADGTSENKMILTNKSFGPMFYKEGQVPPEPIANPGKVLVHGTSLERARQIKQSKLATGGTWVSGYRGGVIDAQTWAENSFTTNKNDNRYDGTPVVVVAMPKEDLRKGKDETSWVTFGKRAEERKGYDITLPQAELEDVKIFKINKHKSDRVNLEEIEEDSTSNNLSVTGRIVDKYAESKQLPFTAWDLNDIRKRVQERELIQLPTEEEEQNRQGLNVVYNSGSDIRKDMKQAVRRIINL